MPDPREDALRLLRGHLEAAAAIIDGMLPAVASAAPAETDGCPHCGERREEKLDDSTYADEGGRLVPRVTCLSCGKSFNPKPEEEAVHG